VIGGDDLETKKPDPEGLLRLAAAAGVPPGRAALVGDSAVDVRTARAAGAVSIGVAWGYDVAGMRAAGPDVEIAAPSALVDAVLLSIRVS
jgi:phosphoglycolate phosphatase-like HAD superfamily hydrolase